VEQGVISLEDGRTLPGNYHDFAHGYAVTAHRSQGKTVDAVIISADVMKQELFYVAASRGRSEIAVVTSDCDLLRESVGVSTTRMSAIELVRKQQSAHGMEKAPEIGPAAEFTRHSGKEIGEQHSVPSPGLEPGKAGDFGIEQVSDSASDIEAALRHTCTFPTWRSNGPGERLVSRPRPVRREAVGEP
jgi:hypothetical protein